MIFSQKKAKIKEIKKQAVLIIHGIGEQRPMSTLKDFVEAILGNDDYTSKPDMIDSTYELRKLSFFNDDKDNVGKVNIDFYEYYWAYRFRDSKFFHVFPWVSTLFLNNEIPSRLKGIRDIFIGLICIVFVVLINLIFWKDFVTAIVSGSIIITGLFLILKLISGKVVDGFVKSVGDASRFMDPSPDNISERYQLKKHGIDVLRRINEDESYDRVVIVGHSLGSVIGYEILKHFWIEINQKVKFKKDFLEEVEFNNSSFVDLQNRLWNSQIQWKISDFITIGSPLTYSNYLLAKSNYDFERRKLQFEFPTCPPQKEKDGSNHFKYGYYKNNEGVLHHAALFALTKWTNIYFDGDIIAGKLCPLFGNGIRDIKAKLFITKSEDKIKEKSTNMLSHVKYWQNECGQINSSLSEIKNIIFLME